MVLNTHLEPFREPLKVPPDLLDSQRTLFSKSAPTFRENGSSSNVKIHFKIKGLRGDYRNSALLSHANNAGVLYIVISNIKFSQTQLCLKLYEVLFHHLTNLLL